MAILTAGDGKTYTTLGDANTAASDGDIILVYDKAGGYTEDLTIEKTLTFIQMGTSAITGTGYEILRCNGALGKSVVLIGLLLDGLSTRAYGLQVNGQNYVMVDRCTIKNCLYTDAAGRGIYFLGGYGFARVKNSLIVNCDTGIYSNNTSLGSNYIDNLTIAKCGKGFDRGTQGSFLSNCLIAGCTTGFSSTPYAAIGNVTDDATGQITGFATTDFVDYDNNDFRLKASVAATTKALIVGYSPVATDGLNQVRKQNQAFFAGYHDPVPALVMLTADEILDGKSLTSILGTTVNGNVIEEAHTDDEVVDTASVPGNYSVQNLTTATVKKDTTWGVNDENTGDYYADVLSEAEQAMLKDIHQFMGLDAAKPLSASGDGVSAKTLTVDGKTISITNSGITRT